MVADGWLTAAKLGGQVTGTQLTGRSVGDKAEDPQPGRVAEQLESRGQLIGLAGAEWLIEQWLTATFDGAHSHPSYTLTFIDTTTTLISIDVYMRRNGVRAH